MTLSEFNRMDLKDQLSITWDKGILEGNFTHERHYFLLYKLFDFFVEIAFDAETDDILGLSCFS
jgi:hypothetical protein